MKSIRQLLRQPLKTLAGILLTAVAVCVLCVSLAQTLAAAQTAQKLNRSFISVALPSSLRPAGADSWISTTVESHPEIFKAAYSHGLASAYIPALEMDNYEQHLLISNNITPNQNFLADFPSYSGAMLEITLITEYYDDIGIVQTTRPNGTTGYELMYTGYAVGVVERVIGLEPGYPDPTGYRVKILLSDDFVSDTQWQAGQRYLIYSTEYEDLDWKLRSKMTESGRIHFWGEDLEVPQWELRYLYAKFRSHDGGVRSQNYETTEFLRLDPNLYYAESIKCSLGDLITYVDRNQFMTIALTVREPDPAYPVPTVAALGDMTAEEFLQSRDGVLWKQTLENIRINYKTFPVIGVDDLAYVADFCLGNAEIAAGRDFTEEELTTGAKVCIISKEAAQRSGLQVGDTLDTRFYNYDYDYPYQEFIHDGDGAMNPTAYRYAEGITEWAGEAEIYTIVGLYEQDYEWNYPDENFYAFTSNTVFVPKSAVVSDMDVSDDAMFRTWVIDNESLLQLQLMSVEAGYDGVFDYYDNGYNAVAKSLESYEQAANRMLPVGFCIYAVTMALFLFLFPGRMGRTVAMLDSMGTGFFRKTGFVLSSTAGILIPGTGIGTAVSLGLWQEIAQALMDFMGTNAELTLDALSLWTASLIQVAAVLAFTVLVAVPMAWKANLMKHR